MFSDNITSRYYKFWSSLLFLAVQRSASFFILVLSDDVFVECYNFLFQYCCRSCKLNTCPAHIRSPLFLEIRLKLTWNYKRLHGLVDDLKRLEPQFSSEEYVPYWIQRAKLYLAIALVFWKTSSDYKFLVGMWSVLTQTYFFLNIPPSLWERS